MKTKNAIFFLFGLVFLFFSNGRWSFPLAAWLYPVFFLFVSRNLNNKYTYITVPILIGICLQLSFWNFTSRNTTNVLFYIPYFAGIIFGLIFLADRLLYNKEKNFRSTLFFPLLYTSVDFLNNLFNPFGNTGILGYSQFTFLPFAQLASLTGMWGLTFMITWFGSVAHWFFDRQEEWALVKKGVVIYAAILVAILSYGSMRLVLPLQNSSVRVAGIHTSDKENDGKEFWKHLAKKDTVSFKKATAVQLTNLISKTRLESRAGAKIVLWSEVSPTVLLSQGDSVKRVLETLAKELGIYLIANPYLASTGERKPENKIWFFNDQGEIVMTHFKYGGNFLEGSVEGDRKLKTIDTEFGRLSSLICWDADFPSVVKQVGKLDTDILFNPASDWREIDPIHAIVAAFRSIENGVSLVRQTRNGLSLMTDPRGKVISQMDHFENTEWVNVGCVPNKKIWTLYPVVGDVFGWLAILTWIVLVAIEFKSSINHTIRK